MASKKGFEEFEPIFLEIKAEWEQENAGVDRFPFLIYVHALDSFRLDIVATDYHFHTWERVVTIPELEDLRDDIGIGGTWSEFVDYLISSLSMGDVRLIMSAQPASDSDTIRMPPKEGPRRPPKRAAPAAVLDRGSVPGKVEREAAQLEKDREIKRLRLENQRLQEEIARAKSQTSSASIPMPLAGEQRRVARKVSDEEGVSLRDFLRYDTPEFRGEEEDDPQEFLQETEKVIRRLPCSEARAVELVGMRMKGNAWDWYQQHIEDRVYSDSPPTWQEFRQAVMDEFLPPGERQRRATQFERLRQTPGMSVADYAREFTKLSKYAPYMVPNEAARIDRFRAGLVTPLYYALTVAEFPSLSRAIDKAKQIETRHNEDKVEREQKKKGVAKSQGSQGRMERQTEQPAYSVLATQLSERKKKVPYRDCDICERVHLGPCKWRQDVCYRCGQSGHFLKDCPQRTAQQSASLASQATVQMERPREGQASLQGTDPLPAQSFGGRGRDRVFTLHPQEAYDPDADMSGATHAKLIALKSKGLPRISFSLNRVINSSANDVMADLALSLLKACKKKQNEIVKEQDHSTWLMGILSSERERNDSLQKQLDALSFLSKRKVPKSKTSDKASIASDDMMLASEMQESSEMPSAKDSQSVKISQRAAPVSRRAKVRGVSLQDTGDIDDH